MTVTSTQEREQAMATPAGTARKGGKKPLDVLAMFPEVAEIRDAKLRQAVIDIWQELWAMSEWTDIATVPTSQEIPYPTLPHNQSVMRMALDVAASFEKFHGVKVNRDHLIAEAALQDASKVVEMRPGRDGKPEVTEIGKAYPHAFWVAHLAVSKGLPDAVCHVLLTHTPQAAKFPDTIEGKILYYVDQLDVIAIFKDRWRKDLYITK
jgi:hypothetical protein